MLLSHACPVLTCMQIDMSSRVYIMYWWDIDITASNHAPQSVRLLYVIDVCVDFPALSSVVLELHFYIIGRQFTTDHTLGCHTVWCLQPPNLTSKAAVSQLQPHLVTVSLVSWWLWGEHSPIFCRKVAITLYDVLPSAVTLYDVYSHQTLQAKLQYPNYNHILSL